MKKKLFILFLTVATAVCLAIGITACGGSSSDNEIADSSGKQVPVYQGMVISSATGGVSALSYDGGIETFSSADFKGDGNVSGDILGSEDVDKENPFGEEAPTIEEEIEASFGVTGAGQAVYYADADEDILITVKFSNPDSFEILSFKINGQTYASYMFEYGSDMENIIVKLNVGSVAGFNDYTIDEIKYVDGTEIKDVLLNGDTSVRCGVRTDETPSVVVSGETAGLDSISFSVRLHDVYDLIAESGGYAVAVLYDGTGIVEISDIVKGTNTVTFSSLSPNTVYEYAVIAVYDDFSGDGTCVNYFYTNALRTEAMVLFDNVVVTKTGVSFGFSWAEGYDDSYLHTKFTLETNGVITGSVDPAAREIDGLLSDTEYTLNVAYTGVRGETESIRLTFTTLAMETPEISISSLTATKTEINYSVAVTDADGVVKDVSVSLIKDGKEVESKTALSGTFDGLYSGTQYGVTVTYTYNLNDGRGDDTSEETRSVTTAAMSVPKIYSYGLSVTKTEISYSLTIIDDDGTGSLASVSLSNGDLAIGSSTSPSGSFTGLLSGYGYTLTATYTYDLNDGYGMRELVGTSLVTTEAVSTPKLEIYTLTSTTEEITYELVETDRDDVGSVTSITLYRGAKVIYTATEWAGTFSDLLSGNEYTLVAAYAYDLNDGKGVRSVEVGGSVYTKAKATPTISVYSLTSTKDSISYDIILTDKDSVVLSTSVVLSKGSKSWTGDSSYGTFTGLLSDNEYIFTIELTYDLGDGNGVHMTEVTETVYTKPVVVPVVEIELTASKEGIDYSLSVSDEDEVMTDISVALYKGSEAMEETSLLNGSFTGLLSDNDYTVKVVYSYDSRDGSDIHTVEKISEVRTIAKDTPFVVIDSLASTKEEVTYGYFVTDADGVMLEVSVTLSGAQGTFTDTYLSGEFDSLWSDSEYILTVSYSYDLGDGLGTRTAEVSETIKTLAKESPTAEIIFIGSTTSELTFAVLFADEDSVGSITNVELYSGTTLVNEIGGAYTGEITFDGLSSYTLYKLTVAYEYDLVDGTGTKTGTVEFSYYTDPDFSLTSVSVINTSVITVGDTITIQAIMDNPDGVKFTSVVINGKSYDASSISQQSVLFVNVVVDDLIDGGNTDFTISSVTGTIGGSTYTIYVEEDNTASAFVYGDIIINDFSLARFTNGRAEETRYRFLDEQIYFAVSLRNGTRYEVYSVTIDKTTYSGDSVTMSDDMQTVFVAANSISSAGWTTANITGITYGTDSYGERAVTSDITVEYMTLSGSGSVYEIYTAEELMNTDLTGYNYYKLMDDIDLAGYETLNLGNMVGVFDGNGHTISNVRAVTNVADQTLYLGLFKEVTGIIMNLDLCDMLYMVTLTSSSSSTYTVYAGSLAATSDHMIVENCNISSSFQLTNESGGNIYIGAISGNGSTSSSSNRFYYNVLVEMNASLNSSKYYFTSYTGKEVNFYAYDSTCTASVTVSADGIEYIVVDDFKYSLQNGKYLLIGYYGHETSVTLPESVYGNPYGIGEKAFYNNTELEKIVFPDTLTTIEDSAFDGCTSLASMTIPNNVTSIGEYAFRDCTSLTSLIIPDSVTSIGKEAFYNCSYLKSLTIGEGVISIGNYAFYDCLRLEKIYYNAMAAEDKAASNRIFNRAGRSGKGITLTIGVNVTEIPAYMFNPYDYVTTYPPNIKYVVFEDGCKCTNIGRNCFYYCDIEAVFYLGDTDLLASMTIESSSSSLRTAPRYYYSEEEPTENGNFWHYVDGEVVIWTKED